MTPIELQIEAIAANVRMAARNADGALSVVELVDLLGTHSHTVVILLLSVLSMIWGPPGYAVLMGIAIVTVSTMMMLGKPLRLGRWISSRRIPGKMITGMMERLAFLARLLARLSRPRLEALAGESAKIPTGLLVMLISLPMALPIPFINAVPNVGIAIICVSRINRDGLGVVIGTVVGLLGVGIAVAIFWGAISLAQNVLA
ncbi:exopolysaccharide biosynthesis protein [Pelagibacterium sp. 26DY04]|uniref:exopolysaccharide biosynthesis protein n=1 Tax=Pelagibacterium sp. 26DY04 TaxID=2967130 RepID=UPI00281644B0|nr:exopolysaccharide biosynthesis protein [Pelagibacterium sp. 26DY04]WMT88647.1 exopolysaccharide biosynthesis protein [Pelagibacterium sp. 26DY04]